MKRKQYLGSMNQKEIVHSQVGNYAFKTNSTSKLAAINQDNDSISEPLFSSAIKQIPSLIYKNNSDMPSTSLNEKIITDTNIM